MSWKGDVVRLGGTKEYRFMDVIVIGRDGCIRCMSRVRTISGEEICTSIVVGVDIGSKDFVPTERGGESAFQKDILLDGFFLEWVCNRAFTFSV